MKHVAIILVNYNNTEATNDCLDSLEQLSVKAVSCEIIVVDNASTEPFQLPEKKRTMPVTVKYNKENLGFTGGNNTGIQYALDKNAEYILLLNNDTTVHKDLLQELVTSIEEGRNRGIAVPKIYYAAGSEYHLDRYKKSELGQVFWYAGGSIDWTNVTGRHRGVDDVDRGQYDKDSETTFASGCCMLVKREVFEHIGTFDDRYFLYYEDADLSERVRKAGYTIWYTYKAIVWHKNAGSTGGSGSELQEYYISRNRLLFGMLYGSFRLRFALLRESIRLMFTGRRWQKKGIMDFFFQHYGKGSYTTL